MPANGQQDERIIRFHADIVIDTTGRIEVAEHIRVYAAGIDIRRGIIREIPIYRRNNTGRRKHVDIRVLSVQCNGADVPYLRKEESGHAVIRTGDENTWLTPGEYDYTIRYESYGHIGFFDDFDELYWNVTGNGSVYVIESASASITLPGGATAGNTACYTGVEGASENECTVEDRGNIQVFKAARPLAPGGGLTVAVAFPRDIVKRSSFAKLYQLYLAVLLTVFSMILCLLYATIGRVGRPRNPVVIPTFKPPRNLSPASVNYLYSRMYENTAFTVTLIEMAVKGAIAIRYEGKKNYTLLNGKNTECLQPEERQLHATLLSGSEKVEVDSQNHTRFSKAENYLKNFLQQHWNLNDYFCENRKYVAWYGVILNLIFMFYLLLSGFSESVLWAFAAVSPLIALEFLLLWGAGFNLQIGIQAFLAGAAGTLLLSLLVIADLLSENGTLEIHGWSAGFFASMSLLYFIYTKRIRVYTPEGARLTAELKGFRMYLKTAEEHRLNILTPPEHTPELFEKLLPYAVALGVSNEWCNKFSNILTQLNYQPEWFVSKRKAYMNTYGFMNIFTASLTRSIASSVAKTKQNFSSSPSSPSSGSHRWSSGSSGGGRSGGGGGGGRTRGW